MDGVNKYLTLPFKERMRRKQKHKNMMEVKKELFDLAEVVRAKKRNAWKCRQEQKLLNRMYGGHVQRISLKALKKLKRKGELNPNVKYHIIGKKKRVRGMGKT